MSALQKGTDSIAVGSPVAEGPGCRTKHLAEVPSQGGSKLLFRTRGENYGEALGNHRRMHLQQRCARAAPEQRQLLQRSLVRLGSLLRRLPAHLRLHTSPAILIEAKNPHSYCLVKRCPDE